MSGGSNAVLDLSALSLRDVNAALQEAEAGRCTLLNPGGTHALACGLQHPVEVTVTGHAGYYCAGMNKAASVTVEGNASTGVAENMMSGIVRVKGNVSQSAGATAHGGLLVIEGDASARCGISLKGAEIVVGGSVGHMRAFMAQAGALVVCGDAHRERNARRASRAGGRPAGAGRHRGRSVGFPQIRQRTATL
jgi:glutamate synthase domain-containing protein 3